MKKLFSVLAVILGYCSIEAGCGLASCPTPLLGFDKRWISGFETRATGFDLEGHSGHYFQNDLRMEFRGWARVIAGVHLPVITLWESGGGRRTGLGNAVAFAEGSILKTGRLSLAGGLQAEFPTGDTKAGLAGDHAELLGYFSAAGTGRGLLPFGTVGFRAAFAGEHAHEEMGPAGGPHLEHHLVLVNPHGNRELVYRVGSRMFFPGPGMAAEVYMDGQSVVDGEAEERNFLALGFAVEMSAASRLAVRPAVEIPLGSAQRFEWAAGLKLSAGF